MRWDWPCHSTQIPAPDQHQAGQVSAVFGTHRVLQNCVSLQILPAHRPLRLRVKNSGRLRSHQRHGQDFTEQRSKVQNSKIWLKINVKFLKIETALKICQRKKINYHRNWIFFVSQILKGFDRQTKIYYIRPLSRSQGVLHKGYLRVPEGGNTPGKNWREVPVQIVKNKLMVDNGKSEINLLPKQGFVFIQSTVAYAELLHTRWETLFWKRNKTENLPSFQRIWKAAHFQNWTFLWLQSPGLPLFHGQDFPGKSCLDRSHREDNSSSSKWRRQFVSALAVEIHF